jgi:hypothetical protein
MYRFQVFIKTRCIIIRKKKEGSSVGKRDAIIAFLTLTMSLGLVASYGSSSGEESDEEEVSITGRNPTIFFK